jgi:hypothetical protein
MDLRIEELCDKYGTTQIATAMGLPISTVHSWKRKNCIPGKPGEPAHEFRVGLFQKAVKKLRSKRAT